MKSAHVWMAVAALAGAVVVNVNAPVHAQSAGEAIRLSAWAVNMSNIATGANAVMEIRVDRWSSERERDELIATFVEGGQDRLLAKLRDVPIKGRIHIPSWMGPDPYQVRLGWNLRFAMRTPTGDGGADILLATDRYMNFFEVRNRPRTYDYPFTFVEIRLASDGTGEGKMAVATQLRFDKREKAIVFEDYSSEPVRLMNVKVEKSPAA